MAAFKVSKRQKFVTATLLLLAGILIIRMGPMELLAFRYRVIFFAGVALLTTVLALKDEDFSGVEWITLPLLPTLFALAAAVIYPLLPQNLDVVTGFTLRPDTSFLISLVIKMAFLAMFVVGYYATLLTSNIFNVAAVRSIQLLRVAHSIGFLVSVTTALLFYTVIASFHLTSLQNFGAVFLVTLGLSVQAIWSVNLESTISTRLRNFAIMTALIVAEIAWVLSFWPVGVSIFALFLTAIFYELVGIVQYHLGEKLSKRVANEFVIVAVAVFVLTLFTTVWGG